MQLFYRQYADSGKPLLILHGLFGQQGNWAQLAKAYAEKFRAIGIDARNHGQSPHAKSMSYVEMADDLLDTMDAIDLEKADVIGHSMGGKIAMQAALRAPERISKLVVADIAPVNYDVGPNVGPNEALNALVQLDLSTINNRQQAYTLLQEQVPDKSICDFLLSNLQRDRDGRYQWRMNLPVIARDYSLLKDWPATKNVFQGETLFVKGELSSYLLPAYTEQTLALFPNAKVKVINGAGHWVHNEKPEQFLTLTQRFLLTH